jgi:hypothetical protein
MKSYKTALPVLAILLCVSLSCTLLKDKFANSGKPADKITGPPIDFTTPGKGLDVKVQLDKKQTASGKVTKAGGSVSLTAADGSKFTLDVPANAVETDATITMTAVQSLDGAPLDKNTPTAVQLEPSGLFFKEMATLSIVPGKEIPIKEQIIFGYNGDGKDYHLSVIDPKSNDIKIKLMHFSGAGVGSGSDAAWAANLMIQARDAETRLSQKFGEYTQQTRRETIIEEYPLDNTELFAKMKSALDQYEYQVVQKEMVASELDCHNAPRAIQSLLGMSRQRNMFGFPPTADFEEKYGKLSKIAEACSWPYQIVGGLDDWQTSTKVCDIMKPFTLTGSYGIKMELSGGLSGTYNYKGQFNTQGTGTYTITLPEGGGKPGTMTGSGEGSAEGYSGSGTEKYTLTPIEPCS